MKLTLSTIPGILISIGGIITVIVIGGLYVAGLFKGKKDDADDRLVKILKETVDALELKSNKQSEDIEALTKNISLLTVKLNELERENSTLIEVLQGRDVNTLKFQEQMLETVRISMDTNFTAKDTNKKVGELISQMDSHLKGVSARQLAEKN